MNMKKQYDFSKGKRGSVLPTTGKTRITIYIDNDVLNAFREAADREGGGRGYQTVINEALRAVAIGDESPAEARLRKIVQEELLKHADAATSKVPA
jgi:hypothetical protein